MGRLAGDFDPEICRRTCHPKRIYNRLKGQEITYYFCKGIIGPLTQEQIREYCR